MEFKVKAKDILHVIQGDVYSHFKYLTRAKLVKEDWWRDLEIWDMRITLPISVTLSNLNHEIYGEGLCQNVVLK